MPDTFGIARMDYHQQPGPTALGSLHQGHALVHALGQQATLHIQSSDNPDVGNNRWSQYHHMWRHQMFMNGKTTAKELVGGEEKKLEDGEISWNNIEAQAAFLGPNLWDKTLPYDTDFKEVLGPEREHALQYVDLDEFLSENGITGEGLPSTGPSSVSSGGGTGTPSAHSTPRVVASTPSDILVGPHDPPIQLTLAKRERSPSPSPCEPLSPATLNPCSPADSTMSMASSGREFDPRTRTFSDEELKPAPMSKKSRKQFVPDDLKDEKYWARRRKNNMAAKRSRDARRMKENQIALRAGFLEKENMGLRQELDRIKKENLLLRDKLSKYEV